MRKKKLEGNEGEDGKKERERNEWENRNKE
jgi:hypothetical protein